MNDSEKVKYLSYLVVALIVTNCLGWFFISQGEKATSYSALADLQSMDILAMRNDIEAYQTLIDDTITRSVGDMTNRINSLESRMDYPYNYNWVTQWELTSFTRGWQETLQDMQVEYDVLNELYKSLREELNELYDKLGYSKTCDHPDHHPDS
jgi:hypothetical protein